MGADNHHSPGLGTLLGRVARVALGGIQTRAELLAVEWQEERLRLVDLVVRALGLLLLSLMGVLFSTLTIILLFPARVRLYVTAGFAVLYLLGAIGAWVGLRSILKRQPFADSIEQIRKDRVWLESLR